MAERQITDQETELNRVLVNPSRFADTDTKAVLELRAGITRLRMRIAGLSVYDIGHDLIPCIFEAFYRQRDHWAREEALTADGKVISTAPCAPCGSSS